MIHVTRRPPLPNNRGTARLPSRLKTGESVLRVQLEKKGATNTNFDLVGRQARPSVKTGRLRRPFAMNTIRLK